jgi:proline racemase
VRQSDLWVNKSPIRIHTVDSHIGGEPTRVVVSGGPLLGDSSLADRSACFRSNYDQLSWAKSKPKAAVLSCAPAAVTTAPCGTGISAKLACLYPDGRIRGGEVGVKLGSSGSIFKRSMIIGDRALFPHIKKSAFITSEARLIIDDKDPFAWGIRT